MVNRSPTVVNKALFFLFGFDLLFRVDPLLMVELEELKKGRGARL